MPQKDWCGRRTAAKGGEDEIYTQRAETVNIRKQRKNFGTETWGKEKGERRRKERRKDRLRAQI